MKPGKSCCSGAGNCCAPKEERKPMRPLVIDFLFLDLSVCSRCRGTDRVLDEAIADAAHVLKAAGMDVTVNKINISTRKLAIEHRFISSPTIRVNGVDIDADVKETQCESCGELCGEAVDCRVWTYNGAEYTEPPKAMIVNALLQAVYGGPKPHVESGYELPDNLKRFFDAMEARNE